MHWSTLSSFHRMGLALKETALTGTQAGGRRKRDFPVSEHAVVCTSSGKDPKLWSGWFYKWRCFPNGRMCT